MKKGIFVLFTIGMLLLTCSGAWAYSMTFTSILTDSPGTASFFVGVWDPSDPGAPAYTAGGFWGYEYEITNIDYDTYLTDFAIDIPATTPVILVNTPTGWNYNTYPGTFGWDADTGYQLYTSSTATEFKVKSTDWPYYANATTWRSFYSPAYGPTLGPGIPEPASAALLGLGLFGLIGGVIRKKFMA